MTGALKPFSQAALVAVACALGVLLPESQARGEQARPAAGEPPSSAPATPAPDANAPEIQPDAVSSFVTRTYRIKPAKLWKGLLENLTSGGYPPEEVDEAKMRVKTSFVDFEAKDYSEHVADPPPQITATYQILQMVQVKQGKVSLEAIVAPGDGGTAVLSLRARILVQGLNRKTHVLVLADRRSSGVIESDFLQKLEETLKLKRI